MCGICQRGVTGRHVKMHPRLIVSIRDAIEGLKIEYVLISAHRKVIESNDEKEGNFNSSFASKAGTSRSHSTLALSVKRARH